jgi:hypothetical protein
MIYNTAAVDIVAVVVGAVTVKSDTDVIVDVSKLSPVFMKILLGLEAATVVAYSIKVIGLPVRFATVFILILNVTVPAALVTLAII